MTRLFQIAIGLAAVLLFLWAMFAHAGNCGVQQQDFIFTVAYGQYGSVHGGMPWPDHRPEVKVVGQEEICASGGYPQQCAVKGLYRGGVILLVDTLDFENVEDTTVLMHEDIHFLQEIRLGPPKDCLDGLEREQEAYRLQAAVLLKVGRPVKAREVLFRARQLRCLEHK